MRGRRKTVKISEAEWSIMKVLWDGCAESNRGMTLGESSLCYPQLREGVLEEELRAQEERAASRSLEAGALTRLAGALSTLEGAVMGMTAEQGRNLLRALIRRVVWDGRGVHVLLAGSPPAEVEPTLLGEDSK